MSTHHSPPLDLHGFFLLVQAAKFIPSTRPCRPCCYRTLHRCAAVGLSGTLLPTRWHPSGAFVTMLAWLRNIVDTYNAATGATEPLPEEKRRPSPRNGSKGRTTERAQAAEYPANNRVLQSTGRRARG